MAESVSNLRITVTKEGTNTVLALMDDLDVYASASLRECIVDLAQAPGAHIVVDLADVRLVDSTGLGTLVDAFQRVRRAGGDLGVRSPTPATRRTIEISGLGRILPVLD